MAKIQPVYVTPFVSMATELVGEFIGLVERMPVMVTIPITSITIKCVFSQIVCFQACVAHSKHITKDKYVIDIII